MWYSKNVYGVNEFVELKERERERKGCSFCTSDETKQVRHVSYLMQSNLLDFTTPKHLRKLSENVRI